MNEQLIVPTTFATGSSYPGGSYCIGWGVFDTGSYLSIEKAYVTSDFLSFSCTKPSFIT